MNSFFKVTLPSPHSFSSHPGVTGKWGKQWIRNKDLPISLAHVGPQAWLSFIELDKAVVLV